MAKLCNVSVRCGDVVLEQAVWDDSDGAVYETRGLARDADTGNVIVVYNEVVPGPVKDTLGQLWVRRYVEWIELVTWPDGERRPRFVSRGIHPTREPPFKVRRPVE